MIDIDMIYDTIAERPGVAHEQKKFKKNLVKKIRFF